jgi:tetraacyldisaccharide 4'-kinase
MSLEAALQRLWYGPAWRSVPLWPLEALYRLAGAVRRMAYSSGVRRTRRISRPVIVVGNLTVGGTGKTPVAAWLAQELGRAGHKVGIVLRGYGGSHTGAPRVVRSDDASGEVGDEALLHARRGTHVVVIGADRVAAAETATQAGADVIVCDDGLQHLALARDFEIVVADAGRGFGNGHQLPAGPLRESTHRVESVDALLLTHRAMHGATGATGQLPDHPLRVDVRLRLGAAVNLVSGERRSLESFAANPVLALAAIGHPEAFFAGLRAAGLTVETRPLPDHAQPTAQDFAAAAGRPILMTEKDAVKCRPIAGTATGSDAWYVELEPEVEPAEAERLLAAIRARLSTRPNGERPRG